MPFTGGIYTRIKTFVDGGSLLPGDLNNIQDDFGNQIATTLQRSGINDSTVTRRGRSIIATSEARTNVAYGTLTTPDTVTGINLPTNGFIVVLYWATWQESVANAANAGLFLSSNHVKIADTNDSTSSAIDIGTYATVGSTTAARARPLTSYPGGLTGCTVFDDGTSDTPDGTGYTGDVTTGQVIGSAALTATKGSKYAGGPCYIFADPGTYDISVQFKSTSGSVTVSNRKLWVWTVNF